MKKLGILVIGSILCVVLALAFSRSVQEKSVSSQQGLSQSIYDGVERSSFYVPVRDGTKLAMNIYWPTKSGRKIEGKRPVIFVATPYRARFFKDDSSVSEAGLSPRLGLDGLRQRGFIIAVADIRGKGASFGTRRGFQDRTEAMDGYDLVEWLAAQSWSNGKIGMVGCSYLGGAAMHVASTTPPSLRAVFAGATDLDKYAFVKRGGITAQFNTRPDETSDIDLASVPVDADTDGSQLKTAVAEHENNMSMAGLWRGMPYRDSVSPLTKNPFWDEVGMYNYLDKMKAADLAFYHWGNWEDEPTAQTIMMAKNVGGKLLIGPGSHCVPPKGMDLSAELGKFFDQYLNAIDTGITKEPLYSYWMNGAQAGQEWQRSSVLPGQDSLNKILRLSVDDLQSGRLDDITVAGERVGKTAQDSLSFTVDYNLDTGSYFSFWVKSQLAHGVGYTTEPLSEDLSLLGYPMADLNVSVKDQGASVSDALVFVYLEDVSPKGEAKVISFGRLAASHRAVSSAPYDTLGLPWHSGREADIQSVRADDVMAMKIGMTPVSETIKAGHRLRLVISGADPRQRNLKQIQQNPAPILQIHSKDGQLSTLLLRTKAP